MPLLSEQKQTRNINYLNKDFDSIKADLIDYVKRSYPSSWQDFSDASGGMALLDMIAYVGDMLCFYIDRQVNEGFINRAVEERNIIALAENLGGYKSKVETPSVVNLSISATLVTSISSTEMFKIKKGSRVAADFDPGVTFEILNDVDFSVSSNRTVVHGGGVSKLAVSGVSAIAGNQRVFTYTVANAIPFLKIILPDADVTEVISVSSSDGAQWYEVDYLAQDTVFVGENNATTSSGDVNSVMKMKRVPNRFVVERETGRRTSIRFGSGILSYPDSVFIPNPEDYVLPPTLRGSASGFIPKVIDSSNFLNTRTLGVAPQNVSLTVVYRFGGGVDTNVGANVLTSFDNIVLEFNNPAQMNFAISATEISTIQSSILVTNPFPAGGGRNAETFNEIRQNAAANFNAQNRVVTLQDYQVRVMTMPGNFGSVFRSYARKDKSKNLGVELILVSLDSDGYLCKPNAVLKNNVETYIKKFKSFSDTVELVDGRIVDLGINFSIVPEINVNTTEAMLATFVLLRNMFNVRNSNFGDTIVISDITRQIQDLDQVRSVAEFSFFNRFGTVDGRVYSNTQYNIAANTTNGILKFPEDIIYEIKYLNFDIIGRTV